MYLRASRLFALVRLHNLCGLQQQLHDVVVVVVAAAAAYRIRFVNICDYAPKRAQT